MRQADRRYLVLDGQQQLRTLQHFYGGLHEGVEFSLRNVADEFKGLTYRKLFGEHRRLIDDAFIQATIEVFSLGFAVHGRVREAFLQVSTVSRPSAECLLAGACSEGPRWKSLTTRCRPGQRRRSQPSKGTDS